MSHWPTNTFWYDQIIEELEIDPSESFNTEFEDWPKPELEIPARFGSIREAVVWLTGESYTEYTRKDATKLKEMLQGDTTQVMYTGEVTEVLDLKGQV